MLLSQPVYYKGPISAHQGKAMAAGRLIYFLFFGRVFVFLKVPVTSYGHVDRLS